MEDRGVTRPGPLKKTGPGAGQDAEGADQHGGVQPEGGGGGGHTAHGGDEDRRERLERHHETTLWVYWALVMLGVWMIVAPATFGHANEALQVAPSGGRGVWFGDALHTDLRARLLAWSDVLSGILLVVFGWRSLKPDRPVSLWITCFVGVWLTMAPVVLWAPTAAAYLNDTVVGMLVIALSILIPGMPNMILYMKMGGDRPPGWSYNPSSWPQRWIMIALGFAGFLVSRYLAAYQLGYLDAAWDPFFGPATERVLDSRMSHMWPVSDAALGTFAYTFEFLMGFMGAPSRWRTMPWMVTFFGILVIPLGLVHIALVISQPVIVGAWCTLCLVAAAIMLPMIPLEVDEVVAMGQHLARSRRRGVPLREAFWKGGPVDPDTGTDERSPPLSALPDRPGAVLEASLWGMSVPWSLLASAALGVFMMASPGLFGDAGLSANIQTLGGSLVVTASVIAWGEPVRLVRYLNVPAGLGLASVPVVADPVPVAGWMSVAVGLAVLALALPRGPKRESYGTWDRFVR